MDTLKISAQGGQGMTKEEVEEVAKHVLAFGTEINHTGTVQASGISNLLAGIINLYNVGTITWEGITPISLANADFLAETIDVIGWDKLQYIVTACNNDPDFYKGLEKTPRRFIKGTGSGYIATDVTPGSGLTVSSICRNPDSGSGAFYGTHAGGWGPGLWFGVRTNVIYQGQCEDDLDVLYYTIPSSSTKVDVTYANGIYIDGELKKAGSTAASSFFGPLYLMFSKDTRSNSNVYGNNIQMSRWVTYMNGVITHFYVPYKNGSVNTMIDLMDGSVKSVVGTLGMVTE